MDNYIALLLLVVPGYISISFFEKLNHSNDKKGSLETTIYALIFSIFIILFNYIVLITFDHFSIDLNNVSNIFSSANFIVLYILITIISSLYIGYLWDLILPCFYKIINCIRTSFHKTKINKSSVFASYFDNDREHLVKIERAGTIKVGFLDRFKFEGNKISEISVIKQEEAEVLIESLQIKNTYSDEETIITEYNIDFALSDNKKNAFETFFKVMLNIVIFVLILGLLAILCRFL